MKILGQADRAEEQEPREEDKKKAEPLLHHDVSPVRESISTIASFSYHAECRMLRRLGTVRSTATTLNDSRSAN